MRISKKDKKALKTILAIANRSRQRHGNFASLHESYGVMAEEFDEYWDEVKKKNPDKKNTRLELMQIAAMCLKTLDIL